MLRFLQQIYLTIVLLSSSNAWTCTAFLLNPKPPRPIEVGYSFDWRTGHGLLLINKRGVEKIAFSPEHPEKWISRWGSVTLNQHGREFPYAGINEAGLVVSILQLELTEYPRQRSNLPTINEVEWVQRILDTASDLSSAIHLARKMQVVSEQAKVHYFVCDAQGHCAVFEYLQGQLQITETGAVPVLTNSPYEQSLQTLGQFRQFGGNQIPDIRSSHGRFAIAASLLSESAFNVLDQVEQKGFTKWQVRLSAAALEFRTIDSNGMKLEHQLDLKNPDWDWSCKTPVLMFDLSSSSSGDIEKSLIPFDPALNRQIIWGNDEITLAIKTAMATYVDQLTHCRP